ncbi:hypothetical protein [Oceanospirillum linum]|uniref:Uncharacterized protein n=1 Tax=Oceanospirillum linum TaxID=966 RepID=A0A1T1H901_OCELI|nr:hypothetical protein [Oceanospirillum linum]OOV86210.1 hypothetical protein BTA35_0214625 [Oceanospirillum linum]SEG38161.1 hypothetical protein SAMN04489856_10957 [Oleiphilus messinensis]SMP32193.1 hypothetical protein SAMN06264348_10972 [Oceanospirillum linum]
MTFSGIITIVMYSLKPYWPLLLLLAMLLLITQWMGRNKKGSVPGYVYGLSLGIGIIAALLAPAITLSKLSYVQTTTDILALVAVALGTSLYAILLLSPLVKHRA